MIPILNLDMWMDILEDSCKQEILIFKHSSTCTISKEVRDKLVKSEEAGDLRNVPIYEVVVQENRDLSNRISEDTKVKHETPQIIMLKNCDQIYNASHFDIDPEIIKSHL